MKLAFISDTHFGDRECTLIDYETIAKGEKFDAFAAAAGTDNDYLVLIGDIFDFSINSYEETYKRAKVFFELVKEQNIAKSMIYLPGNHDFDMWHTVQQEKRIIHQVRQGKPAQWFRWSSPGFIDDRSGTAEPGFRLPGVFGKDVVDPAAEPDTDKLFLNGISINAAKGLGPTNFYVAYPNLYMITDEESVLITHGHYLEAFWTLSGEWVRKITEEGELPEEKSLQEVTLENMVALNVPLCQLSCSGIGQAGSLTPLVQKVQREVKNRKFKRVERYLDRLTDGLDELTKVSLFNFGSWGTEVFTDIGARKAKKKLIKALKERDDSRYSTDLLSKPEVQERFRRFYQVSWREARQLKADHGLDMPQPRKVIFGHTHRPFGWDAPMTPPQILDDGKSVRLFNTGGWLWKYDDSLNQLFCGAEVFTYNSDDGFGSTRIE